jgi:pSer/pThr/pTyr-binding forkhead associated (FHA) protein
MPSTLDTPEVRFRGDGAAARRPGRYLELGRGHDARRIALEQDILHLGRGLGADLRFDVPSVSRRHAVLVQRREEVRLLDDRSVRGTFVNGRRVIAATLADGDEIALGDVVLTFHEA